MKSAICPKCFAQLTEEQWVYCCHNSGCKELNKVVKPPQTITGRGGSPACPCCNEDYLSPLCPDCWFQLRLGEQDSDALSISLVGAPGSGKSHFLSVMIEEIKRKVSKTYNCALFPLGGDETIDIYEHQYYQPLYSRGQCLDPTEQDDVNPLIYSLVFQRERGAKALGLTLYDSCGANFESISAMANLNRSIYHSGGIIFFIDPGQLPSVGEWQATHGMRVCDADAVSLLSRTVHLIRDGNGKKSLRQKLDIPIAVCLTKLDTVQSLLDVSSFVKAPSRHLREASFDKVDFEACSLEVQSIIESWGGGEIIQMVTSQFSNYGFFGLSALGNQPTESGGIHHIVPHRIADPLLWMLWKKKMIGPA